MDSTSRAILEWLSSQHEAMVDLLTHLAEINSGSENSEGLMRMADELNVAFTPLNASFIRIPLPPRQKINSQGDIIHLPQSDALLWKKRPEIAKSVLLAGHMDTVYPPHSPFQKVEKREKNKLNGPGVADMKGGLVILLYALLAFEKSPAAQSMGWEILINPDEEIGSPGSASLFEQAAQRHLLGLVFEPSFTDGSLVSSRKGSANYSIVVQGVAAHSGRDYFKGRNAIIALSKILIKAEAFTNLEKGTTVNAGFIEGGTAPNIVPNKAMAQLNIRVVDEKDMERIQTALQTLINEASQDGIQAILHVDSKTPPKPFDQPIQSLFSAFEKCASTLEMPLKYKPSGGACDGSRLYASGLPNIDTLGAIGGNIHTDQEFIEIDSLVNRAKLTALFLNELAQGHLEEFVKEITHEPRRK